MKKTFTQTMLFACCLVAFVSCAKEVKRPVSNNVSNATTSKTGTQTTTTTNTTTTTQTQSNHTCGGGSYSGGTGH